MQLTAQQEELAEKNSFQKEFQPKVSVLSFCERIEREKTKINTCVTVFSQSV
jgi:hypothetical protein